MNRRIIMLAAAVLACAPAPQQATVQPAARADDAIAAAVAGIRPADFYARIGFLASDALGGRDTPSPGLEAAAAYIASEFHRNGLTPAGDPGSFIQRWPYTTRAMDAAAVRAAFTVGGTGIALTSGTDFYARPGVRGSFTGGLTFVGAELPASAARERSLTGSAVMVAPAAAPSAQVLGRMRAAADSAGAGALIIVLGADVDAAAIATQAAARSGGPGSIPVFYLRRDRANELFRAARLELDALARPGSVQRYTRLANTTATLNASMLETVHQVPNVAGLLEGSDPVLRNEYIVFSAHIDHVGSNCRGTTPQDQICNGADDDASGTAAIMELAEAFASLPTRPRRSLIFLGVSAEEKGLLGSRWYADNPTVPIENIVANVNIDMIGRNNPDSVVVIGQTYSSLGPLLHQVNERNADLRMTISDDLWPEQRFFFRSDHFNFARREVPAIFFFTGTHEDYHGAGDTVDKIDLDKITRITRLVFHYGAAIANDDNRPRWDPAGLEEVRRLISTGR